MRWETRGTRGGTSRGRLERSLCRGNAARGARVELDRHAQRAREGLEHRLAPGVRVVAARVVDVHGRVRVVDEALEGFVRKVDVELADASGAGDDEAFE